ncbi:MAG: ABC transporter ATP-binding protein [Puniceicoccales bacterium]|jgi:ABC-2 type transport system ATP-binding protein|nr:ABC transporter ATP-binding protein [Puniceicoccales bacterium]
MPASASTSASPGAGVTVPGLDAPPVIEAVNLCKTYGGVTAIENLSLRVGRGEIVGFLGPNGAGKSTTMRILSGLMPATSGAAFISGIPVAWKPESAKMHLGYMPENNPLPEDLRVVEYLRWRAKLKGVPWRRVNAEVDGAMERCDLVRKTRGRLVGTLSKGFRQRVGIADALLGGPDVIILDEPTIGLDPHQILSIRRLIKNLGGRVAVLISSHILPEIEQMCDRVIIVNQGRVVASGTTAALRAEFIPRAKFTLAAAVTGAALEALLLPREPAASVEGTGRPGPDGVRRFTIGLPSCSALADGLLAFLWGAFPGKILEFHATPPDLEEIFIEATHRCWEDETKSRK